LFLRDIFSRNPIYNARIVDNLSAEYDARVGAGLRDVHEASMLKQVVGRIQDIAIILMDSISSVDASGAGQIVLCGSHGGRSSGEFSTQFHLAGCFFNDAGGGKDDAGLVALQMLDSNNVPAGTVSHLSARIGDALDTWESGVLSHVNGAARDRGIATGDPVSTCVQRWLEQLQRTGRSDKLV
jgi:hypothetical protein